MKGWLADLVNFLFPAECHVCNVKLAPQEEFVCTRCLSEFPRTGFHRIDLNPMEERFAGLFPFEKATSLFFYARGSNLSKIIQDMKYRSFPSIGDMLGRLAAKELFSTGFFTDVDYIVPVPMHWFKKASRGYNQAERIASGLSKELGLEKRDMLVMRKLRKVQAKLSLEERLRNADNIFAPKKIDNPGKKSIVLIDDICTTGATLASAAKTMTDKWPDIRLKLLTIGVTF